MGITNLLSQRTTRSPSQSKGDQSPLDNDFPITWQRHLHLQTTTSIAPIGPPQFANVRQNGGHRRARSNESDAFSSTSPQSPNLSVYSDAHGSPTSFLSFGTASSGSTIVARRYLEEPEPFALSAPGVGPAPGSPRRTNSERISSSKERSQKLQHRRIQPPQILEHQQFSGTVLERVPTSSSTTSESGFSSNESLESSVLLESPRLTEKFTLEHKTQEVRNIVV